MINNYTTIFNECVLQASCTIGAQSLQGLPKNSYKVFCNYIAQSDQVLKRAWSINNGFIILSEAILQVNNKK
jgi:hypothetical protein